MIRWEPGVVGPEPDNQSVASAVSRLIEVARALAELDDVDPDTDSIRFDRATDGLIAAIRDLMDAARPILTHPHALHAAVADAIDDRSEVPEWCRDCQQAVAGMCGDHDGNIAQAQTYAALLPAVAYDGPANPATG